MVTTFGLSFDALEKEFDPVKAKILSLVNLPRKYHFYGCKVFVKKYVLVMPNNLNADVLAENEKRLANKSSSFSGSGIIMNSILRKGRYKKLLDATTLVGH